jgi:hypothetical protein
LHSAFYFRRSISQTDFSWHSTSKSFSQKSKGCLGAQRPTGRETFQILSTPNPKSMKRHNAFVLCAVFKTRAQSLSSKIFIY